jgi:RsiW-degrading membrane proteinase PrsW (M82 family)
MEVLLLALAILPGILICLFIYRMDKYEKESPVHLYLTFSLGMLITVPVLELEEWTYYSKLDVTNEIWLALLSSFVIVALSEELIKFAALLLYPFRRPFFNEPIDGIVYAVMIAMGFATLENILYAFRFGIETIILRAFTAVPAHASFAVMMGYFAGRAKFHPGRRLRYLLTALGLPVVVHGIYDFFILQEAYDWLILVAIPILALSIYFAWRMIRLQQEDSPFKDELEDPDPTNLGR